MEEKTGIRPHRLMMQNRSALSITGIRDVVSFDENQVILDTDMGLLTMKGKDLHVSRLTLEKGEVDVDGTVDSLVYLYPMRLTAGQENPCSAVCFDKEGL